MDDIDWNLNPRATHFIPGDIALWYREEQGRVTQVWGKDMDWGYSYGPNDGQPCLGDRSKARRRPDSTWDGIGLPPVGIEFEWRYGGHSWKTGEALYIGRVYVILKAHDHEQHYYLREMEFRPIRTPEQIAVEIRSKAIDVMLEDCGYDGGGASFYTCAGLYDAGYRKVPHE